MSLQICRPTEKRLPECLGRATDKQALALQPELDARFFNPNVHTAKRSLALHNTLVCVEETNGLNLQPPGPSWLVSVA